MVDFVTLFISRSSRALHRWVCTNFVGLWVECFVLLMKKNRGELISGIIIIIIIWTRQWCSSFNQFSTKIRDLFRVRIFIRTAILWNCLSWFWLVRFPPYTQRYALINIHYQWLTLLKCLFGGWRWMFDWIESRFIIKVSPCNKIYGQIEFVCSFE